MGNPNNDNLGPPPPYPYQQPLQGQRSGEYAPYPQLSQEQLRQQGNQGWGNPVMGVPANPSAHPGNQQAAQASRQQSGGQFQDSPQGNQSQSGGSNRQQDPYVQQGSQKQGSSNTGSKSGGSMDKIKAQMADLSKQANEHVNRMWGHLSTGPSMADTAWGRVTTGTQLLTKGGFEGVFKSTFQTDPDEKLKKTYACFLSTSTGPVAGTLYISTKRLGFCSDRPLAYQQEGQQGQQQPQQQQQQGQQGQQGQQAQQSYSYYKVVVPVDRVTGVNPSVNEQKPAEKYIQITTLDNHEFWFMGFVNYEKGVQNLQAVLGPANQQQGGPYQQQDSFQQQGSFQQQDSFQQQSYPPSQGSNPPLYPPNQNSQQQNVPPNEYQYFQQQDVSPNQYGTPAPNQYGTPAPPR